MRNVRARAMSLAGGVVALSVAASASAQTAFFAIPAQSVETGIVALGRQGHVQIMAVGTLLHGRKGQAVEGDMPVPQALQQLLKGTGLAARQIGPGTYVVVEAAAVAHAAAPHMAKHAPRPIAAEARIMPAATRPEAAIDPAAIIVTGSRTIINGNDMPTPVTVVTGSELLENQPSSVIAAMNELPALLGSLGPTTNINTGGLNAINLRGIGVTRALLMVDGRRAGPTAGDNTVNPDVVPQILLKRVDVVTGGVSAIYGSDAVAGVVNFITDTGFQGLKVNLQNGVSTYGDDRKFDVGAAWGGRFAQGRGHVEIGVEHRDAPGIRNRRDRPFLADTIWSEQGAVPGGGTAGTATNPYVLTRGAVLGTASYGGLIGTGPLAGLQFGQGGQLSAFRHGVATGTPGVEIGGDGATFVNGSLSAGQRIDNGFTRADYDLSRDVHAYASLSYTHFRQSYTGQNPFLPGVSMGYDNPFLAKVQPAYQAVIAQQPVGSSFRLGDMLADLPNYDFTIQEHYYQASTGLGGVWRGAAWNADYVHSDSRMTTTNNANINTGRLFAALDTVSDGKGGAVCNAARGNPATYGACVPLDIFGSGAASQQAIDYIEQATHTTTVTRMDDVSATVKGGMVDLPAGPLKVALSGEWRRMTYRVDSDALGTGTVDCAGIRFNCNANTPPWLGGGSAVRTPVSQAVTEAAMEANVPILRDRSWARSLSLNVAARYTHYDTSGSVWTWKLSGDWQVSDDVRLRLTRSRDIRAPSLLDLFAPETYVRKTFIDAHTGTSGFINFVNVGNPDLKPERADTWTAGLVYKPRAIPGLSVSLDYYHIAIANAMTELDGYQPSVSTLCDASGGTAPICSLIVRPLSYSDTSAANFPLFLRVETFNVATARAYGIDAEINYATCLFARPVTMRIMGNWQPHVIFDNGPGGVVDVGDAADGAPGVPTLPSVKILASVAYEPIDGLRLRLRERWRNAVRQNGNAALYFLDGKVPAVGYTDFSLTYAINASLTGFVNVQNVFNAWPPPFASSGGSGQINYLGGFAQGDDIEGRFFTVGLRLRM